MAQLQILHFPDPRLRSKARPVSRVDDGIRRLVEDMFETMYAAPGVGLAAVQVNVPVQVITIDVSEDRRSPLCLINPRILTLEGAFESDEGCLSVPGVYEPVQRASEVRVEALDKNGIRFELDASGLLAVCIQHEIDHLAGKLFVDHLSSLKRQRIRKKMEKQQKVAS